MTSMVQFRMEVIHTMYLPEKIKTAREEFDISQETLVYKLRENGFEITRQTLGNYENGCTKPEADKLCAISELLNVPIGYFFT